MSGTKPSADVDLVVTAANALAALDAFGNRFNSMLDKIEKGTRRNKDAAKETGDEIGKWATSFGRAALGAAGFLGMLQSAHTVAGLIRKEVEATAQVQRDAAAKLLTFNDAMDSIRFQTNPKGTSPPADMSFDEIRQRIKGSTFGDKTMLANVVRAAISSDPVAPYSERVNTAIEVAELRPDMRKDRVSLENVTRAVLMAKRLFGGTTKDQMGMLDIGIQASAVDDPRAYSEYLAPIAAELLPMGFTQKESYALGAAYGSVVADFSGPTTRTNMATVMTQLYTEALKRGHNLKGMELVDFIQSDSPEAASMRRYMIGVIEEGLDEEGMREASEFGSGKTMGRTRGKIPFMNLFQPKGLGEYNGSFKQVLAAAMAEFPDPKTAGEYVDQKLKARAADPEFAISRFDVASENFATNRELDPNVGIRDKTIGFIDAVLMKTRDYKTRSQIETFLSRMRGGDMPPSEAVESVISLTEQRARTIETMRPGGFPRYNARTSSYSVGTGFSAGVALPDQPMSDEERREVADLRELLGPLKELVAVLKENQGKPQPVIDQTPKLKEPATPAAGGISNQ